MQILSLPATLAILSLSLLIPTLVLLFPNSIKYFYFDHTYLRTFQIHRLITALFLTTFDLNFFMNLLSRYQILTKIEGNPLVTEVSNKVEIIFFFATLTIPLVISNLIEGVNTFHSSVNMALIKVFCDLTQNHVIVLFGFNLESRYVPYLYFAYEMALSGFASKCYYGLIWATLYSYLRKMKLIGIPLVFIKLIDDVENKIRELSGGQRRVVRRGRRLCD